MKDFVGLYDVSKAYLGRVPPPLLRLARVRHHQEHLPWVLVVAPRHRVRHSAVALMPTPLHRVGPPGPRRNVFKLFVYFCAPNPRKAGSEDFDAEGPADTQTREAGQPSDVGRVLASSEQRQTEMDGASPAEETDVPRGASLRSVTEASRAAPALGARCLARVQVADHAGAQVAIGAHAGGVHPLLVQAEQRAEALLAPRHGDVLGP
jgi:hypothetical protein